MKIRKRLCGCAYIRIYGNRTSWNNFSGCDVNAFHVVTYSMHANISNMQVMCVSIKVVIKFPWGIFGIDIKFWILEKGDSFCNLLHLGLFSSSTLDVREDLGIAEKAFLGISFNLFEFLPLSATCITGFSNIYNVVPTRYSLHIECYLNLNICELWLKSLFISIYERCPYKWMPFTNAWSHLTYIIQYKITARISHPAELVV